MDLDTLCDDFAKALARGERPSIREWARTESAIPGLAAIELHYRLAAGEAVTAREYFEEYPAILDQREAAVQLVAVEYQFTATRDASISESLYRERYPELANAQEWSNGPWVSDTAPLTGTGTEIQQLPPKASSAPTTKIDLPDYLANLLQSPFADHPNDLGRLGEYRIFGLLGRGGMGAVLKGANVHSGHPVAIKVMLPGEAEHGRERFLREARAAQKIDHPRVVPIYHVGEANGFPYIAMKQLEGQSLKSRIETGTPMEMAEVVRIGREIAEGLDAAHRLQMVHRDLKPDNIWLEHGPDGDHVRILDFGLARPIGETLIDGVPSYTKSNVLVGTPAYMSPEQADGRSVDARSDLWSLGVVLYRMVAKRYPFGSEPLMKVLKAIANDSPRPLHEVQSGVPMRLSNLVSKLLEKNPDHRPQNASEVIRELDHVNDSPQNHEETTSYSGAPVIEQHPAASAHRKRLMSCSITITISLMLLIGIGISLQDYLGKSTSDTFGSVASKIPDQPSNRTLDPSPKAKTQLLTVESIRIDHFANTTPEKEVPEVEPRGVMGTDSFDARFGDVITVDVTLSTPAYCYIVVFRPDGVAECIFPDPADADKPPEKTNRPRYPLKSREDYYGLTDGTGLWIIGVVASPKPLQSFSRATNGKTIPKFAGGKSPAETVFSDDGLWVDTKTKLKTNRGTRGAGAKVEGPGPVIEATNWLKALVDDKDVVATTIGFVVRPRE